MSVINDKKSSFSFFFITNLTAYTVFAITVSALQKAFEYLIHYPTFSFVVVYFY